MARDSREGIPYGMLPKAVAGSMDRAMSRLLSFYPRDFVDGRLLKPSTHLLNRNAKFLRALLVFTGARAVGSDPGEFVDLAVALELLHTSSLIHDDIIDGDTRRRGVTAVHKKFGSDTAILAGDALMAKAVELSSGYGRKVISLVSESAMRMCAGELQDYECQKKKRVPSQKEYLDIARLKCAALIGAASGAAAVFEGSTSARGMRMLGEDMGMAYQIRDDALDFATGIDAHKDFKPNIVDVLQAHGKMGVDAALRRAAQLNNRYLDSAARRMRSAATRGAFGPYLDFVRLQDQTVTSRPRP